MSARHQTRRWRLLANAAKARDGWRCRKLREHEAIGSASSGPAGLPLVGLGVDSDAVRFLPHRPSSRRKTAHH